MHGVHAKPVSGNFRVKLLVKLLDNALNNIVTLILVGFKDIFAHKLLIELEGRGQHLSKIGRYPCLYERRGSG